MFRSVSIAQFKASGGHEAQFMIDNAMPVPAVLEILQKLMHFCVERQKEAENELAQEKKDEEASRPPELENAEAVEVEAEVEEQPVEV
jgi:hypothetical protein